MKKGYSAEYAAKNELINQFGRDHVIKTAIGQSAPDFLIIESPKLKESLIGIEVKHTLKKKFYPSKREIGQWKYLLRWVNKISQVYYWICTTEKNKRKTWEKITHAKFGKKYLKEEYSNEIGTLNGRPVFDKPDRFK